MDKSKAEAEVELRTLAHSLTGSAAEAMKLVTLWQTMGRSHNAEAQKLLDIIRSGE